ncbi:MAG TPA: hypothetical protein VKA34_01145, partial [Balneolales bacterium]|nr:hypothetical protein [Balneolales bacterium]
MQNTHYPMITTIVINGLPGRAVRCLPAPPQIRTSRFPAYGSSAIGFANRSDGLSGAVARGG